MAQGKIIKVNFNEMMARGFTNYALSVITDRALPDVFTGLKPVQQKIIQSMADLGLWSNSPRKKSAKTTGNTLSNYHPHGDQSVYDAMVVLAQPFNTRYPLVDMQGNVGDLYGNPAAAMRYTESRLSVYGELMIRDIKKNTVDMVPNYDESGEEAVRLPSLFPSLLCNGTSGIAVALACNFLPHNAKDVYKALLKIVKDLINNKWTSDEDIIQIIKAPDFPTGGVITSLKEVEQGYKTGRASIPVRSKYTLDNRNGYDIISISEIPYGVNMERLNERIREVVREKNLEVKDISDYSAKGKIRYEITCKRGANVQFILNTLFKHTDLKTTVSMNHVALVNGIPKENLSLKDLLGYFVGHAMEVIKRRTQFDLNAVNKRLHILSAFMDILSSNDKTDKAIEIIRKGKNKSVAVQELMSSFGLEQDQATFIGDQKLWNLNVEQIEKLQEEVSSLTADSKHYELVLSSHTGLLKQVYQDLSEIAELFKKDERKTELVEENDINDVLSLVEKKTVLVTLTNNGIIKALDMSNAVIQHRGGKGAQIKLKDDDFVRTVVTVSTHDRLLIVTEKGRGYLLPVYKLPVQTKQQVGKYVANYVPLTADETVLTMIPIAEDETRQLIFVLDKGIGKRMELSELPTTNKGAKMISIKEDDKLIAVQLIDPKQYIFIATHLGLALKIPAETIPLMGKQAMGNILIRMVREDDIVVSVNSVEEEQNLLVVTSTGIAKRLDESKIRPRVNRGGKGMIYSRVPVAGVLSVKDEDTVLIVTSSNKVIRTPISKISQGSRNAKGVKIVSLGEHESVVLTALAPPRKDEEI